MNSDTRATLLERLQDVADPLAWDEFFRRYWRLVYACVRRRGGSDDTAEEIVQDVMLAVFQQRAVFRYDPARGRFRDWLAVVVGNKLAEYRRRPSQRVRGQGGDQEDGALEPAAEEPEPDAAWQATFEEAMLAVLLDVVRNEVTPETYQAFELLVLNDLPGSRVAEITGQSRNAVYLAKKRVLGRLKELGAAYRDDGQLPQQIKQALQAMPAAAVQRSVTSRLEQTRMSPDGRRATREP